THSAASSPSCTMMRAPVSADTAGRIRQIVRPSCLILSAPASGDLSAAADFEATLRQAVFLPADDFPGRALTNSSAKICRVFPSWASAGRQQAVSRQKTMADGQHNPVFINFPPAG